MNVFKEIFLSIKNASDTAGFKCTSEKCPSTRIMISTAIAGDAAIPMNDTSCEMITPVAAITNKYVPKNSTANFFSIGGFSLSLQGVLAIFR